MNHIKTIKQLCLFGLVGSVAALINLLLVIILVEKTTLSPLASNPLAFMVAFGASYIGHYKLTFKTRASHKRAFPRFLVSALIGLAINESLLMLGLHVLHWNYIIALFFAILIAGLCVFTLGKCWSLAHE